MPDENVALESMLSVRYRLQNILKVNAYPVNKQDSLAESSNIITTILMAIILLIALIDHLEDNQMHSVKGLYK